MIIITRQVDSQFIDQTDRTAVLYLLIALFFILVTASGCSERRDTPPPYLRTLPNTDGSATERLRLYPTNGPKWISPTSLSAQGRKFWVVTSKHQLYELSRDLKPNRINLSELSSDALPTSVAATNHHVFVCVAIGKKDAIYEKAQNGLVKVISGGEKHGCHLISDGREAFAFINATVLKFTDQAGTWIQLTKIPKLEYDDSVVLTDASLQIVTHLDHSRLSYSRVDGSPVAKSGAERFSAGQARDLHIVAFSLSYTYIEPGYGINASVFLYSRSGDSELAGTSDGMFVRSKGEDSYSALV